MLDVLAAHVFGVALIIAMPWPFVGIKPIWNRFRNVFPKLMQKVKHLLPLFTDDSPPPIWREPQVKRSKCLPFTGCCVENMKPPFSNAHHLLVTPSAKELPQKPQMPWSSADITVVLVFEMAKNLGSRELGMERWYKGHDKTFSKNTLEIKKKLWMSTR